MPVHITINMEREILVICAHLRGGGTGLTIHRGEGN